MQTSRNLDILYGSTLGCHVPHRNQAIKKQGILQFCEKVAISLICLLYHFLSHGISRCLFIHRFVWAQIFLLTA